MFGLPLAVVGPALSLLGGAFGWAAKIHLDRRKAKREAAELEARTASAALADRADERDHDIATGLIDALTNGLAEVRAQIASNHGETLQMLREERDRTYALAERAIAALADFGRKSEVKRRE